jgi:hypothetical protein
LFRGFPSARIGLSSYSRKNFELGPREIQKSTKSRQEHLSPHAHWLFMRQLIEQYLAQAAEYDRRAKESAEDETRAAYMLLAEHWRYLAKELEKNHTFEPGGGS